MNDANALNGETLEHALARLSRHPSRKIRSDGRLIAREIEKIRNSRPDWPKELHEQYLLALGERDDLQERLELTEERLSEANWRLEGLEK